MRFNNKFDLAHMKKLYPDATKTDDMDVKTLTTHLQEQLILIQRRLGRKWFNTDDVWFLSRADWVLERLTKCGAVEVNHTKNKTTYRAQECEHVPVDLFNDSKLVCVKCNKKLHKS